MCMLQHMHIEQAPIEIGYRAQQYFEFWRMDSLAESLVEEFQQEVAIEAMELVLAAFLLHAPQAVREIIGIAIEPARQLRIEEALALDEVDEHQAVEHERGIPLAVSLHLNPLDKLQERSMFQFEAVVELSGHA